MKKPVYLHLVTLTAITWLIGYNSLSWGFVWDDFPLLLFKPAYRTFDLKAIFLSLANGLEYLPVRDLSYAMDFAVWGMSASGFHLTNVIIYWLTVMVVYGATRLLVRLLHADVSPATSVRADNTAFFTTLLFAVHPLHSEVLCFITQRNTLLAGLFFFLALWCFLKSMAGQQGPIWYGAALVAFVLSIFSKGIGIVLPLLLLLVIIGQHRRAVRLKTAFVRCAPFAAISVASFFLFSAIARSTNIIHQGGAPQSITAKIAIVVRLIGFYLGKLAHPVGLAPEYDLVFEQSLTVSAIVATLLLLALTTAGGVLLARRFPLLNFSFGWFLLTLLPFLNLFPTSPFVADRYAYLPSYGLCLVVAALLSLSEQRYMRIGSGIICCAIALWLGGSMVAQNRIWQSGKTLWTYTINSYPGATKGYRNLANIAVQENNMELALKLNQRVSELDPRDPGYDYLVGQQALVQGDAAAASEAFGRAIRRDPEYLPAYYQLAGCYEKLGNKHEAVAAYQALLAASGLDTDGLRDMARRALLRL